MRFDSDLYLLLKKSSGIAKKAVLDASQSPSRFFGFRLSGFLFRSTPDMPGDVHLRSEAASPGAP